jgi:outer membrane lipoprotein carrier protein
MSRSWTWAVLIIAACLTGPAAAQDVDERAAAAALAVALQKKYDLIKDFSTDFVHEYRGGVLKRQLREKGRLFIKKPGKMRWEYTSPETKLFVSDGRRIYYYIPADKQVIVSAVPEDDAPAAAVMFLAGRGNLTRDFTTTIADVPVGLPQQGTRALKLVPKVTQAEYDSLVMVVDANSLDLRGLMTVDAQSGTSTFTFQDLKQNVGLADKTFIFDIPRGVDVVTDAPRR